MRALIALVVLAGIALSGCSGEDAGSSASGSAATANAAAGIDVAAAVAAVEAGAVIIDVRTPEEFAAGHIDGAVNLDVSADDFGTKVGALDPEAEYVVYCRSGNRSTAAIAAMRDLGFTDLINGGAFDALVAAGLPSA